MQFCIVGGSFTGTFRFQTGLKWLGDKPNEFQRELDSNLGHFFWLYVYLKDILQHGDRRNAIGV